ncbi:hypothetical protein SpCBS45565_g01220 [Spizellomyces sp. 'palustris']|nr:hypothetical protein SpCBS45565_g01220 [Spizellomyces sp. 'palustris']
MDTLFQSIAQSNPRTPLSSSTSPDFSDPISEDEASRVEACTSDEILKETYKATQKQAVESVKAIVDSLDDDAWMFVRNKVVKHRGCAGKRKKRIGEEIAEWLRVNP